MERESRDYSWAWVTSDQVLAHGPCELLWAYLVVSAASTDSYLYDGESSAEKLVTALEAAAATGHSFKPPVPVYCHKGLFVDVGTNVTGILVMWRNL